MPIKIELTIAEDQYLNNQVGSLLSRIVLEADGKVVVPKITPDGMIIGKPGSSGTWEVTE